MFFYFPDVQLGSEAMKALFIEGEQGLQEFGFRAIEDDADVEKFFPFDPRHYANDGILK
jgi:hypothetical protein